VVEDADEIRIHLPGWDPYSQRKRFSASLSGRGQNWMVFGPPPQSGSPP